MKCFRRKEFYGALVALLLMAGTISAGIPGSKVSAAGSAEVADPITIGSELLNVKCQTRPDEKDDSKKSLRMVTTVDDNLSAYGFVGFEVRFMSDEDGGKYNDCKTRFVYQKIASNYNNQKFEFSPKVFHANSKWMATYVIKGIPENYWDNDIIIKPYVTELGTGVKTYGESRHLRISDYQSDGNNPYIVSLAVKDSSIREKVTVDGTEYDVYRSADYDREYSHVRMPIDLSSLKSVTTYVIEGKTVKYRNLYTESNSDTTWYTETEDNNKVIANAAEMRGLSELSANETFAEKTIYLGADINLNLNWTASLESYSEASKWTPIGHSGLRSGKPFAGTFDGDMHSISGVCVRDERETPNGHTLGLFGKVQGEKATIKNFELKNSYFFTNPSGSNGYTGSIVGDLSGTIENVKCDEKVFVTCATSKQYNGGMVGKATSGTIKNCWFDGKVSATAAWNHTGGILGGLQLPGDTCTISNCLFSGEIDARANTGGLVGSAWASSTLKIEKCLYTGKFVPVTGAAKHNLGVVLGNAKTNTTTATDVYVGDDPKVSTLIGNNEGSSNSTASIYKLDRATKLTGDAAYYNMNVDFYMKDANEGGVWFAVADGTPVLTIFADKAKEIDLATAQDVRTCWFDATNPQKSYTLYSPAELRGFQELSATNDFYEIEIKLGNNIDLNPEWDATNPTAGNPTIWTPIGRSAENTNVTPFKGTFNGQGHTILGVYVNGSTDKLGLFSEISDATIQNFTLKNSYCLGNLGSGKSYTGSVVGVLNNSTLDTVKCDEDVVVEIANSTEYNGGMVGASTGTSTISNCWFAGKLNSSGSRQGGISGGVFEGGQLTTVTNCLVTGSVTGKYRTGGLIGTVWNEQSLNLENSLFAGSISITSGGSASQVGTVIGQAHKQGITTVNNVYAVTNETFTALIGADSIPAPSQMVTLSKDQLQGSQAYGYMNVDFYEKHTGKDGTWFAVEGSNPILTSFADKSTAIDLTTAQGCRTCWFDAKNPQKSYTLYSPAELRGFQKLSATNDFYEIEIKLGNDIDLNPEWDATNPTAGNTTIWTPIGRSAEDTSIVKPFMGIFNGQGHIIKGVYVNGSTDKLGLFSEVSDATIKNFTLKNSYCFVSLATGKSYTGSVVGVLNNSTLNTVKCDKDVLVEIANNTEYNGGMAGASKGASTISNCWFAGKLNSSGSRQGGISGGVFEGGQLTTVTNCLVTGSVTGKYRTGGLIGTVWNGQSLNLENSLFAGSISITSGGSASQVGTVIGQAHKQGITTVNNVYAVTNETFTALIGADSIPAPSQMVTLSKDQLQGSQAYAHMYLDFYEKDKNPTGAWCAVENSCPILTSFAGTSKALAMTVDIQWFDKANVQNSYTLNSPAELRGFQVLSAKYDFDNIEIKLGKDIDLNPKWEAGAEAPKNVWTPIGRSAEDTSIVKPFKGIFNGQGHIIKGVYVNGSTDKLGLFSEVSDATIQNLQLENSYISGKDSKCKAVGGIVGTLDGTLDTVKSSAKVVLNNSEFAGGLVGNLTEGGKGTLRNCWFAGSVSGLGGHHGTLIGAINKANSTKATAGIIEQCLSTGTIEYRVNAGGLVGTLWHNSTLEMTDTLFAGSFVDVSVAPWGNYGTTIGNALNGKLTLKNVYTKADSVVTETIGNAGSDDKKQMPNITTPTEEQLKGDAAYACTYLDFYEKVNNPTGAWCAVENSCPILTSFADKSKALTMTVDTYWFDADNKQPSYTLDSVAEFRGFQKLAATTNFANIEIKLGADMDLNPSWDANEVAPKNVWTPIGRRAANADSVIQFKGTFNGQGHTIKGIYVNSDSDRIGLFATTGEGAKIQNFTLENSYINSTKASGFGSVGSVVGRLGGTLDTVKSSADVVLAGCQYAGGLVGDINSTVGATITNCWFAGSVGGAGSHHGQLLGGVRDVSGEDSSATCDITHCLSTGTIDYQNNTGGLVGAVWTNGTVNMEDTLFAGTFRKVVEGGTHGAVVGNASLGTVNVTKVYVQKGSGISDSKIIGNTGDGTHNDGQKANVKYVEIKELYLDDARENTALTIYPQGKDSSSDGDNKQYWWYVSETQPILASFGKPVNYTKLKVATYNIGSCVKLEKENHREVLNDVTAFIRDNNIDVCMLQEVDKDCNRTESVDQAKTIAEALGYEYKYIATLENHYSDTYKWITSYGIAIVSRYPIESAEHEYLDFPSVHDQRRALLKAMINVDGTETAVICTHFDTKQPARELSVPVLKTMLDGIGSSTPIVFAGDINQVYDGENTPIVSTISGYLNSVTTGRWDAKTCPNTNGNVYQLDYIFTNALVECGRAKVYTPMITADGLEGELSDHRPLVVNLYMNIQK